jgi:hypothetical protein
VEICHFDEQGSRGRFKFLINDSAQLFEWKSSGEGRGWTTQTIRGVEIRIGDEITVDVEGAAGRLDYVQLNSRNSERAQEATFDSKP